MEYRILDPNSLEDKIQYQDALKHFLDSEVRLFPKKDNIEKYNFYKAAFEMLPQKDLVVSGKFENNKLVKFLSCQSLDSRIGREDLLPFLVFDFFYSTEKNWNLKNSDELDMLNTLCAEHFLKQGYTKGYQLTRFPTRLLGISNFEDHLNDYLLQTYSSKKLNPQLEQIFLTQKDIENYKFQIIKKIFPRTISRPFMLVSWSLKSKYILESTIECK